MTAIQTLIFQKRLDRASIVSFLKPKNLLRPSWWHHFALRPQFVRVSIKHRWLGYQKGLSTNSLYVLDSKSSDRRSKAVAHKVVTPRRRRFKFPGFKFWRVQTIGCSKLSFLLQKTNLDVCVCIVVTYSIVVRFYESKRPYFLCETSFNFLAFP